MKETLGILIPYFKENISQIKNLLDSIKIQQGVDFNRISVFMCGDGPGATHLDMIEFKALYPFEIIELRRPSSKIGVSAVRNRLLASCRNDYVMFCDADDMFISACGLYLIFNEIEQTGGFDSMTSLFVEEGRIGENNEQPVYIDRAYDFTFVHGKIHNRQFLIDNNIKWNEDLTIHEDSYFHNLISAIAKTYKYLPNAFYLWKYRPDSVCRRDDKYMLKTYNNLIDSNDALVKELTKRGMEERAQEHIASMIYNAYFTLNKEEWINQENQDYRCEVEKRFREYFLSYKEIFNKISKQIKQNIIVRIKNKFFDEGLFLESITFDDWIKQIERSS